METKRITIDGSEYEITQLGAIEGHRLWLRVLKTLAVVVKDLAGAGELNDKAMAGAVASLVSELDEGTYVALCEAFARRCRIRNGEKWPTMSPTDFDIHFAGKYLSMSKWLGECVTYNFASFLDASALGNLSGLLRTARTKLQPESPKDSTGSPGGSSAPTA